MNVGDIMYLKTTNETVQVLQVGIGPEKNEVQVRRPAGTRDNGIIHNDDVFFKYELVTEAESAEIDYHRQLTEYKKMVKLRELTSDLTSDPTEKPVKLTIN